MDRKKLFPIGEVSKLFHISVSSLRRYETIGLLTPAYISPDSGYRYYGPEQFEVLNTIRYLRALDMPLPEIADFLQNRDIDRIEEKLQQQKQAVLQKQQALKRMEQKIDHRLRWLRDAQSAPLDTVCLVQLPACRIVWERRFASSTGPTQKPSSFSERSGWVFRRSICKRRRQRSTMASF